MKFTHSSLLVAAGLLSQTAHAIPTVTAKGSKFFTSDGNQFFIKGIAYQLTNDDPLADADQCQLDVALMKTLGTNAIRVYHVDPTANHDVCMSALSNAGIYAFIDVDTFSSYIIAKSPTWSQSQFNAYSAVVDTFQKYDNVAGFYVGNEVMNSGADSIAAPYVKAAARDLKAYAQSKGYRDIPFGYSAADIPALRPNLNNYLACGDDPIGFYSLNAYEWCGDSSFSTSGYNNLQDMSANYSIPIFISETGCNTVKPRTFGDQAAILGPDMDGTWSGAIIYEWIEETNDYGLISYGPPAPSGGNNVVDGYTRKGTPTPIQPDFDNLKGQWATLTPSSVSMNAYSPSLSPPACPDFTVNTWLVSGNVPLPTLGQTYIAQHTVAAGATAAPTGTASSAGSTGSTTSSSGGSSSGNAASASTSTHQGAAAALGRSPFSGDSSVVFIAMTGFAAFVLTAAAVL